MCGRYTVFSPAEELEKRFGARVPEPYAPVWNVAPTRAVPVVARGRAGDLVAPLMRWGLVPAWAADAKGGAKAINARLETLREKPSFRNLVGRRRCLVPANGYFEWKPGDAAKIPQYVHRPGRSLFAFAGLFDVWKAPDGVALTTFTIITAPASPGLAGLHPRMPVMLPAGHQASWLDPALREADLYDLLHSADPGELAITPADPRLNKVANDEPGLF